MQCVWLAVLNMDSHMTCSTDTDSHSKKYGFYKLNAAARLPHWPPYICVSYNIISIPYTGKLSREKTSRFCGYLQKFSQWTLGMWHFWRHQWVIRKRFPTKIFSPICESFLPRKFPTSNLRKCMGVNGKPCRLYKALFFTASHARIRISTASHLKTRISATRSCENPYQCYKSHENPYQCSKSHKNPYQCSKSQESVSNGESHAWCIWVCN